ncbi:unnamed protein product [Arctogadus glacialis]
MMTGLLIVTDFRRTSLSSGEVNLIRARSSCYAANQKTRLILPPTTPPEHETRSAVTRQPGPVLFLLSVLPHSLFSERSNKGHCLPQCTRLRARQSPCERLWLCREVSDAQFWCWSSTRPGDTGSR